MIWNKDYHARKLGAYGRRARDAEESSFFPQLREWCWQQLANYHGYAFMKAESIEDMRWGE